MKQLTVKPSGERMKDIVDRGFREPSANELREEAERLRSLVTAGTATMQQAERLADIERKLARFNAIRYGRAW